MEIIIGTLAAGLLVCGIFSIKFIFEPSKKQDLDRQSGELNKTLAELKRVESLYQEAKDNIQTVQKENEALAASLKESQKSRVDEGRVEQELKQKAASMEVELASHQKELADRAKKAQDIEKKLQEAEAQGRAKKSKPADLNKHTARPEVVEARVTKASEPVLKPANLKPLRSVTTESLAQERPQEIPKAPNEKLASIQNLLQRTMDKHDRRIGDILVSRKFITKENLDKALSYQKKYGGNVTQYLLYFGCINEKNLALALAQQFKVPYIPLSAYSISDEVVMLIPVDIAEKYWVMPVDRIRNSLVVAMIDPLDTDIHKVLQQITGLEIMPFVSIISEILAAHRIYYYKILTQDQASKIVNAPFFFVNMESYTGLDRRQTIRYMARIDIRLLYKECYIISQTIDVSRGGFAFIIKESIEQGTTLTIEINLPPAVNSLPISVVAQVVRCVPVFENRFQIGVKIIKVSKEENETIISYASMHQTQPQ